eukprot:6425219-Pyramimonas_sp.AAC.1
MGILHHSVDVGHLERNLRGAGLLVKAVPLGVEGVHLDACFLLSGAFFDGETHTGLNTWVSSSSKLLAQLTKAAHCGTNTLRARESVFPRARVDGDATEPPNSSGMKPRTADTRKEEEEHE